MSDQSLYLIVVEKDPKIGWSQNVGTLPDIVVRFNLPLDTALVDTDQQLNRHVILVQMDTDEAVPVTFKSWNKTNRLLTFAPSGHLVAGALYQITLRKTLKTSQGRGMIADHVWSFATEAAAMGQVQLREPGDATAHVQAPQLCWDGVWIPSGSVNYRVEVDTDWKFGTSVVWSTTVTVAQSGGVHCVAIGTPLSERTTYYWRVRAYTGTLSGEWSETRAFFIGTATRPAPDTQQLPDFEATFSLLELLPENGTSHLTAWPTIRATFTQMLSASTVSDETFQLFAAPVDGRLSTPTLHITGGTFTVVTTGKVIDLVPPGEIQPNTRYTIRLTRGVKSYQGESLGEVIESVFVGRYQPFYGGLIAVRAMLGGFIHNVSDDEICFHLWRASLALHQLLYTQNGTINERATLFDLIQYLPPMGETWAYMRYSELTAAISLLESYYYDVLEEAGRRRSLATFISELSVEILPEIREKIKDLEEEREELLTKLFNLIIIPRTSGKSIRWNPNPLTAHARDYSYQRRKTFGLRDAFGRNIDDLDDKDWRRNY